MYIERRLWWIPNAKFTFALAIKSISISTVSMGLAEGGREEIE